MSCPPTGEPVIPEPNQVPIFTAHHVRFLDGGPDAQPKENGVVVAESPWFLRTLATMRIALRDKLTASSVVDLGCLEGGYTAAFAQAGFGRALGVDVRSSNVEACFYVQRRLQLRNLEFVQDDVWNIARYGHFDAGFCCGLLYHLDRPAEFLRLLGGAVRHVVVINTHIAPEAEPNPTFGLSELTMHEGLPGRWYSEHNIDDKAELDAAHRWTSWENRRSFWLTREAVAHALRDAGFDLVFEQFDCHAADQNRDLIGALRSGYYSTHHRAVFVGIRHESDP